MYRIAIDDLRSVSAGQVKYSATHSPPLPVRAATPCAGPVDALKIDYENELTLAG
jgi:hypothetical protein